LKTLISILKHIDTIQIHGDVKTIVQDVCVDSREVKTGSLFIAIKGTKTDAHDFISNVIAQGAIAIICEKLPTNLQEGIVYIQIKSTLNCVGLIASSYFDNPSKKMKVIGVTGTNGKTTCVTLLFQLFMQLGKKCGLVSTVQNQIGDTVIASTHTTPDAIRLQRLLHQMYEAGCTYVFMEVSSHAIHQHRIAGLQFTGACFTNITHDHLDYHETFDEYINVKKSFFDSLSPTAFALSNVDDKRGLIMMQNTKAKKKTYSLKTLADYKAKIIENNLTGLVLNINNHEVFCRMIGEFNAYNLLCVFGVACELDEDKEHVMQVLSTLKGAEGRFDCVVSQKEQVLGIVDYAHTPDALLNVLATIQKLKKGNETLFTIVGCGGDRDKAKRPLMALVACEHSDRIIFTSDNPRTENAQTILHEMETGVPVHQRRKYVSISDRKEAIKTACSIAEMGDIILIAGKGHEKYQEINGVKNDFDDKKILKEMFELFEK
jgi:UDP-N-acetylmuramoyl-L-alanyl-D-glutamate--2,6-diaminopimelate ligase